MSKAARSHEDKLNQDHTDQPPGFMDPASEEFDLFSSPMYLMAHVDAEFHEDLDKVIAKLGFSRTQYRLMTVLAHHNPLNIGDLSRYALVKRSTASHALVNMNKKGWISTQPNDEDNRLIEVELTEEGLALIKRAMKSSGKQTRRAIQGLSQNDLSHLTRTLRVMASNLSRLPIE